MMYIGGRVNIPLTGQLSRQISALISTSVHSFHNKSNYACITLVQPVPSPSPPDKQDTLDDRESPEYQTIIACTPQLTRILAFDPTAFSGHLLAKGLIPHCLHSQLVYSTDTPSDKAQRLLVAMTECIQTNTTAFDVFIAVLKNQGDWTKKIVSMLMSIYIKKRL